MRDNRPCPTLETIFNIFTDIPAPAIFTWTYLTMIGAINSDDNSDLFKQISIPLTFLALINLIFSEYQARHNGSSETKTSKRTRTLTNFVVDTAGPLCMAEHMLSKVCDSSLYMGYSVYLFVFNATLISTTLPLDQPNLGYKKEYKMLRQRFHRFFSFILTFYHCLIEYTSQTFTKGYPYILMTEIFDLKEDYLNYIGVAFIALGHLNYLSKVIKKDRIDSHQETEEKIYNHFPVRSTYFWIAKAPLIVSGNILGVGVYLWEWFKITRMINEREEDNKIFYLICLGLVMLSAINEILIARNIYKKETNTNYIHLIISYLINYISGVPALITILYRTLNNDQLFTPSTWDQATHLFGALNWVTLSLKLYEDNYPKSTKDTLNRMNDALIAPLNLSFFAYDLVSRLLLNMAGKFLPPILLNEHINCPYNLLAITGYVLAPISAIVATIDDRARESARIEHERKTGELSLQNTYNRI